jgi:hypothetical protein
MRPTLRTSASIAALSDMRAELHMTLPDTTRLALTEAALASADRLWREEMRRTYGPDGVLIYGYAPEGQGDLGTPLRRSYEARRVAVSVWRHERHRQRDQVRTPC